MKLAAHTSKDPVSRHATTEYNRFNRVVAILHDAYACAISFHSPQSAVLERTSQMYASGDYKKLSSYYKGKIAGISECLFHSLYAWHGQDKPLLMHISIGPDGKIFPEYSDAWHTESQEYKSSMKCEHIWRAPFEKDGTIRPW